MSGHEHEVVAFIALMIPLTALVATLVIRPWLRLHYASRSALSSDERQALYDLRSVAEKMEARLATLERILDAEAPGWRERA